MLTWWMGWMETRTGICWIAAAGNDGSLLLLFTVRTWEGLGFVGAKNQLLNNYLGFLVACI